MKQNVTQFEFANCGRQFILGIATSTQLLICTNYFGPKNKIKTHSHDWIRLNHRMTTAALIFLNVKNVNI